MIVPLDERRGPFPGRIDPDLVRRYGAATNDPSPLVAAGRAVPPVAVVTQIWEALQAGRAAVMDAVERSASSGVHGEHDVVLHRPITPGEPLETWVSGHAARPVGRNALLTLRYETFDGHGELVAEQWWTTVYLNTTCEPGGPDVPDHRFPDDARGRPVADCTIRVDPDMPHRYAEVSGDWSAHHFDVDAARQSGFDRPFLHGLCTMALCAQAIVTTVGDGDPERVRRVAVRFATPVPVGEDVTVSVHDAGPGAFAFEASAAGSLVITHGRAELRG